MLQQYDADPLYVRLCRLQQSFRARLTPKPWQCGLRVPPASFPFDTPQQESRFRAWDADYAATAARYATCRYLTTFGGRIAPAFEELIRFHDQETKAGTTLPWRNRDGATAPSILHQIIQQGSDLTRGSDASEGSDLL